MISFSTDRSTGVRAALYTGVVDDPEMLQAYGALLAEPDYDPALDDLVDLRGVSRFEVSTEGLRRIISMYTPVDRLGLPTALAIVAASDLTYGMSRMYEMMRGDDVPEEIRVFHSHDEAMRWLAGRRRRRAG